MFNQIREILLDHKGKKNPISSSKIAEEVGIDENATYYRTRSLIFECAEKYKLPLAANNQGYFLITNQDEYDDYITNLNSRIEGIEERKRIITDNFKGWIVDEIHDKK